MRNERVKQHLEPFVQDFIENDSSSEDIMIDVMAKKITNSKR